MDRMKTPIYPGAMTPVQMLKRDAIRLFLACCIAVLLALIYLFNINF